MLATWDNQQTIKAISKNNYDLFQKLSQEVEDYELPNLLGLAFSQDLQQNSKTENAISLLDGGSFIDCNNNTVTHKGLRFVLAWLIYAKYVGNSMIFDTYSGMVMKNRDESQTISEGTIKRMQQEAREIALAQFELIKQFLDQNTDKYPFWNNKQYKKQTTPRFFGVKKTTI